MGNLKDTINNIKKNPNIYLVRNEVEYLEEFFLCYSQYSKQNMSEKDKMIDDIFYDTFSVYINNYLKNEMSLIATSNKWCENLLAISKSEEEAFALFFKVLDNFCVLNKIERSSNVSKIKNVVDYLTLFKKKPKLFIMRKELTLLYQKIYGFYYFNRTQEINDDLFNVFGSYYNFRHYVELYLTDKFSSKKFCSSISWSHEIRSVCDTEEEAIKLFYSIFEQFSEDYYQNLFPYESVLMPISERKNRSLGRYVWGEK